MIHLFEANTECIMLFLGYFIVGYFISPPLAKMFCN